MKKNKILIYLILLLSFNLYAQKSFFNYEPIKIDKIAAIEQQFDSKEIFKRRIISFEKPYSEYEQPKIYERSKSADFDTAEVQYFYSKKDSLVKSINYAWKVKYRDKKDKFFNSYNDKFNKLKELITKEIGTPKSNDSQILKMKSDHVGEFYQKSIIWENDKFTAQIIQVWSKEAEFVDFNTNIHFK